MNATLPANTARLLALLDRELTRDDLAALDTETLQHLERGLYHWQQLAQLALERRRTGDAP